MAKIYLVNVGANSTHSHLARSPIFDDGSFVYVAFPHKMIKGARPYNHRCLPFVQNVDPYETHNDPDWENLTYGDNCVNPRARSLRKLIPGDILLFWAMLWNNIGDSWQHFTSNRGWYLIGSIRVFEIAVEGQSVTQTSDAVRHRAGQNVHFHTGALRNTDRVFIGNKTHSALFAKAVDLGVNSSTGLLYQTFLSADGRHLRRNATPRWYASLRTCRMVFDLQDDNHLQRANLIRQRIRHFNPGFDLFDGLK